MKSGKIAGFVVGLLVIASLVSVAAVYEDFDMFKWSIKGVYVTSTAAELNIMDGVTATATEINSACDQSAGTLSLDVIEGQVIVLTGAYSKYILNGTGSADNITNTFTINPLTSQAGASVQFTVASASSNLLKLADNGAVMALGSDWIADGDDTLSLWHVAESNTVKTSASDN